MTFRLNFNSITSRLIIFGIVAVTASTFSRVFILSNYLRNDLTELSTAQLVTMANYVARDIDHSIVDRRETLQRMAAKLPLSLMRDSRRLQVWLAERHEINPMFTGGLSVWDVRGKALAVYPAEAIDHGMSSAESDYFKRAVAGEFAIGRPLDQGLGKVPQLPMAVPLRDGAGKIRAVLVGLTAFDTNELMSGMQETHAGHTGDLLLVSPRDKLFLSATDPGMAFTSTPAEGGSDLLDRAMSGFRGTGLSANAGGTEELVAIAAVPSSGWFVMARLPTAEAFALIVRLQKFILKNTLAVTVVFILILLVFLRYLLRPLKNAAEHSDQMTRGDIPLEPLPVVRMDEVGHLTVAFNRVLTTLLESRGEMEHMAQHDTLTGLPNRKLLADRMEQALARAKRGQRHVAVMFMDLDGFKPINDELGHDAGDAALIQVAQRLQKALRREDTLARLGGDEFIILLTDLNGDIRAATQSVAEKCLEIFHTPFIINGRSCKLGLSIGIAVGDGECLPDRLLSASDKAMYRAKVAGRGQYCWAEECTRCVAGVQRPPCSVENVPV